MSGSNKSPRVYVFLPVHNRKEITERFLHCLVTQTYKNWHLVLIDDGSSDGTADMARALVSDLTILNGKGDWWWGGSLQQGYLWLRRKRTAPGDLVLLINDDTVIGPGFLAAGVAALAPRSLLLARLYSLKTGEFVEAGAKWDWQAFSCRGVADPTDANCFSTRGLLHRVADMAEIGGFRPWLLPHYLSDYEYTMRAHRKGFALQSSQNFCLQYDETSTGVREIAEGSFGQVLRTVFSVGAILNPTYWTVFVILTCPRRHLIRNLWRVWRNFVRTVGGAVKYRPNAITAAHEKDVAPKKGL